MDKDGYVIGPIVIRVHGPWPIKQRGRTSGNEEPAMRRAAVLEIMRKACPALFISGSDGSPLITEYRIDAILDFNMSQMGWFINLHRIKSSNVEAIVAAVRAVEQTAKWTITDNGTREMRLSTLWMYRSIGLNHDDILSQARKVGINSMEIVKEQNIIIGDRQYRNLVKVTLDRKDYPLLTTKGALLPHTKLATAKKPSVLLCHQCYQIGHVRGNCKSIKCCHYCGESNHLSGKCPYVINDDNAEKIKCRICTNDEGYTHCTVNCPQTQLFRFIQMKEAQTTIAAERRNLGSGFNNDGTTSSSNNTQPPGRPTNGNMSRTWANVATTRQQQRVGPQPQHPQPQHPQPHHPQPQHPQPHHLNLNLNSLRVVNVDHHLYY